MKWTEAQQRIIDARQCNLLVSAAAGSGKTAVLVERIIQMVSDEAHPVDIDHLLVVTFTKAAAAQMRDKIAKALEQKAVENPENEYYRKQLNLVHCANILTIDSFCYQIVKENFHVLDIDPSVHIGDVGEIGLLREEALEEIIEEYYQNSADFVEFSDAYSADKNDEKVEDYIRKIYEISASYPRPEEWTRQAKAALHVESEEEFMKLPLVQQYFVELKSTTRGIRERLDAVLSAVRGIDGPLYMEKAILEDIVFVENMLSAKSYSDLHELLGERFANIGRGKKGTYDEEVAEQIKTIRDTYKKQIKGLLQVFALPFCQVLLQLQEQEGKFTALLNAVDAFRERFLQKKLQKNILEFSDVEHFALQVVCGGYDELGTPQASVIGRELSEQFEEILIDEYQDSNYLQEAILLCVSRMHKGEHNIFMVGDVKQSIYSFRMARPDLFMDKYHTYESEEGAVCRKLLLKNNFRSRANVLESINYLFYQIMGADLGGIAYTEEEALIPGRKFPDIEEDTVELLIGESKNYEFLSSLDEAETAEREENLDEELEDIGKIELEAAMVAKRIRELMGASEKQGFRVTKEDGTMVPASYRDMVILFRAPSSFQLIFSEVLRSYGIPVKVQNEKGYFDTVEIRLLLSLLKVVDNPYQDVEVAAALRGFFGECSSDDLALLVLLRKSMGKEHAKLPLYTVIEQFDAGKWNAVLASDLEEYKDYMEETLRPKCRRFLQIVASLKQQSMHQSVAELLSFIYYEEGYYYYVQAMPDGMGRTRNLKLLLQEAVKQSAEHFCSVFDFLRYVERLEKKSILLGGDPSTESAEDVVRIMSIHKSKGLEFPVVFLAGMGKNFNLMDTKSPLIIHSDYYIGAKYRNTQKRCGNDTFLRQAMAALMTTESIAEELRIFYVGLTRAKDKLIMTGVTPDITALIRKYEDIAKKTEQKLSYSNVHTARNYLDLTVMGLIRNPVFHAAMQQVRPRQTKKGEEIRDADYEMSVQLDKPDIQLSVSVYDFQSLLVQHMKVDAENQVEKLEQLQQWQKRESKWLESIQENIAWRYPLEVAAGQKSKLSVTEIKRIYETDYSPSDVINREEERVALYEAPKPRFILGDTVFDAAQKGTWMHKTMELIDFARISSLEETEEFLQELWRQERIPRETKTFIKAEAIWKMLDSSLGRRMCEAARQGLLHKEKQFVAGVPLGKLLMGMGKTEFLEGLSQDADCTEEEERIVVQGIVDAYFEEENCLILVDYKTDHIKPGQEGALQKRYYTQLQYYKDTLEQLTGKQVRESYLYAFAVGKEIRVI